MPKLLPAFVAAIVTASPSAAYTLIQDAGANGYVTMPSAYAGYDFDLHGSDTGGDPPTAYVTYVTTVRQAATLHITYRYTNESLFGPYANPAYYVIGFTNYSLTAGLGDVQTGTFDIAVTPGERFGFAIYSQFNELGGAVLSIAGATIPEPATWAMFVAGFGAIGAASRRRASILPA